MLIINPEHWATYKKHNNVILLAFLSANVKWIIERRLYVEMDKNNQTPLDLVLQKLS